MNQYVILTDSACDISKELLDSWSVGFVPLTFKFTDSDIEYKNSDMPEEKFYSEMRAGRVAKTAAINVDTFIALFEKELEKGNDVLYIGFSSGLSSTFNAARMAGEQLKERYPDKKIITIDSLAASAGEGLLIYLTVQKKNEGASIEETAEYAKSLIPHICHWFTVDDLVYLKRGGRVSATAAFFGNALGIKPVMHVDDEGHLVPVSKVRGRRTSISTMADMYTELAENPNDSCVFISHGDCISDAELLAKMIKDRHGVDVKIITSVGTVIGAHSGPGTLALFFVGKHK